MKSFITNIFNKYRSQNNINIQDLICGKSWYIFNNDSDKELYIFLDNGNLIISVNGKVTRGTWQYITANKSIIVDADGKSVMLHPTFSDENILVLQLDGNNEFAFLIEEEKVMSSPFRTLEDIYKYFENLQKQLENAQKEALLLEKRRLKAKIKQEKEAERDNFRKDWWACNKYMILNNDEGYLSYLELEKKASEKDRYYLVAVLLDIIIVITFGVLSDNMNRMDVATYVSFFGYIPIAIHLTLFRGCWLVVGFVGLLSLGLSLSSDFNIIQILSLISFVSCTFFGLMGLFFINSNTEDLKHEKLSYIEEIEKDVLSGKYDYLVFR